MIFDGPAPGRYTRPAMPGCIKWSRRAHRAVRSCRRGARLVDVSAATKRLRNFLSAFEPVEIPSTADQDLTDASRSQGLLGDVQRCPAVRARPCSHRVLRGAAFRGDETFNDSQGSGGRVDRCHTNCLAVDPGRLVTECRRAANGPTNSPFCFPVLPPATGPGGTTTAFWKVSVVDTAAGTVRAGMVVGDGVTRLADGGADFLKSAP